MANIRLKELLEANVDPKLVARSKESGKLVYFKTPQAKDAALKAGSHSDPKAEKGGKSKADVKPNDMFGGDYAKNRGVAAPKADPVIAVASRAQMVPKAVAGWADKNGVDLSKVSDDLNSGKLNVFDFMTAVSGIPGNKYAKDIIAKYPQSDSNMNYSQSVKQNNNDSDVDGQTDDELYDALYDMGYDFGKFGSKNFDEEGFADAATNLGYRYDAKNKVWNHRDEMDGDTPNTSKYDDKSYWKDDEYSNTQGYTGDDDDYDDDSWGDDAQFTSDRLSKIEDALKDDLNLRGNGFETTRESGGGGGGWEGPMTIVSKDADYNDEDNYISLSVGSPNNDGKFSIVFANANGEPHFEPNYDALTGDTDLEPQQAYKVTKALMKMPEVQKVLKGEMKLDEFKPIYDKLKSKFSKTESTKLTSMIKK
jgi:hypothetical protein